MAASIVQSAISRGQATASTITCTLPGTVTIGNRLVMVGDFITVSRTYVSTADTNGENWAGNPDFFQDNNTYHTMFSVSAPVTNGGASTTITLTLNSGSGGADAACFEITGHSTWALTDSQKGESTGASSVTSATFAPTGSKSVVFQTGRNGNGTRAVTFTNGSELDPQTVNFHAASQVEVSAGTYVSSMSWTTNTNSNGIAAIAYTTSAATVANRRVIMVS